MKILTITVPCYNSESYMRKCIDSLLIGGEDVEILIVDDGSTKDRTPQIADEYAEKYPTIIRAIHQENKGHGGAVNTGIANATGLYFKVVDSDDWVDPDAYKKVYEQIYNLMLPALKNEDMAAVAAKTAADQQCGNRFNDVVTSLKGKISAL